MDGPDHVPSGLTDHRILQVRTRVYYVAAQCNVRLTGENSYYIYVARRP